MPVKDKRRGRPQKEQHQLSAERILNQAKSLMLENDTMPSIRSLATNLDIDAMAIYYYFKNKNALQEAIAISLIEEIYQPTSSEPWQQALHQLCSSYVSLLHRYSGLLETLLKMETVSPAMVFIERLNTIIEPLALDSHTTKNAIDLLADYLHGFVLALQNQPQDKLNIDMISGPLSLYIDAITAKTHGNIR